MPKPRLNNSFKKCKKDQFALVLDVGTTGVKAFVFNQVFVIKGKVYRRLQKRSPRRGWVEQDPHEILDACKQVLQEVVTQTRIDPRNCVGLGITNQRETTIVWDIKTGTPVYPAIVWEDRRTKKWCQIHRHRIGNHVLQKTGLPLDSYFSASKIRWVLDHVEETKSLLPASRLAFGTVDSWLLWNLCEDHPHVTDETNAARTLLFNIKTGKWDNKLLKSFDIPSAILPRVLPSKSTFGRLASILSVPIPVKAVCGDQQASMYAALRTDDSRGQTTKVTYGTGVFLMQSIGSTFARHQPFFTTLVPNAKKAHYVLEAKIEGAATTVDRLLRHPVALRRYLLTLAKKVDVLIRKLPVQPNRLIIDGGITRDGLMAEIQSQVSGIPVITQPVFDGTALGVAHLLFAKQ